jgi:hypothetical protein
MSKRCKYTWVKSASRDEKQAMQDWVDIKSELAHEDLDVHGYTLVWHPDTTYGHPEPNWDIEFWAFGCGTYDRNCYGYWVQARDLFVEYVGEEPNSWEYGDTHPDRPVPDCERCGIPLKDTEVDEQRLAGVAEIVCCDWCAEKVECEQEDQFIFLVDYQVEAWSYG